MTVGIILLRGTGDGLTRGAGMLISTTHILLAFGWVIFWILVAALVSRVKAIYECRNTPEVQDEEE